MIVALIKVLLRGPNETVLASGLFTIKIVVGSFLVKAWYETLGTVVITVILNSLNALDNFHV
jgi:hypothetical protein